MRIPKLVKHIFISWGNICDDYFRFNNPSRYIIEYKARAKYFSDMIRM